VIDFGPLSRRMRTFVVAAYAFVCSGRPPFTDDDATMTWNCDAQQVCRGSWRFAALVGFVSIEKEFENEVKLVFRSRGLLPGCLVSF
jgi:hypothetical protein